MTHWVYENGKLREARPEEIKCESVDVSKLRAGDEVTIRLEGERAQKFIHAVERTDDVLNSLALPVGQAFMAWTHCCDAVLELFITCTRINPKIATAIFRRIRSDSTQREVTIEAAKIALANHDDIFLRIKSALREIDQLAYHRNVFAHVSFGVHFDQNFDPSIKPKSEQKWSADADAVDIATKLASDLRIAKRTLDELHDEVKRLI